MYSQALLNRERNFLELNKELEEKVQGLMIEVDSIINKQIDVIRTPSRFPKKNKPKELQSSNGLDKSKLTDEALFKNLEKSLSFRDKSEDPNDNDSDEYDEGCFNVVNLKPANKSTEKTINRFLKAQIAKLQTELQSAQYELKKKVEHDKELEAEIKKNDEKREKLLSQISALKETIVKAEEANSDLQLKIQTQVTEMTSLKKENDTLKKDLKSANQVVLNTDLRLHRSLEEIEKLRSSLKSSQTEEKEMREQVRKAQEEKRMALRNLDKQRNEVFQAFKKQTQLVENLKKQKACLEASLGIKFIEDDFTRLLEWKPDDV